MQKEDNGNGTRASSNRNEVTIAVVNEKLNNVNKDVTEVKEEQKAVRKDIKELSEKIDNKYVSRAEHEDMVKDVNALQDSLKWIVRLVLGGLITTAVGYIVVSNKML